MKNKVRCVWDSRKSRCVSVQDLLKCDWWFRFKEDAGAHWTSNDPWFKKQPARKLKFTMTAEMEATSKPLTVGAGDLVWEGGWGGGMMTWKLQCANVKTNQHAEYVQAP